MSREAGMLFGACLVLVSSVWGSSEAQELHNTEVLQRYRTSLSYLESVSMKIEVNVDSNDSPLFPQTLDFTFRRHAPTNRVEWLGTQLIYKEDGEIDAIESRTMKDIGDGSMCVSLEGDRFTKEIPSRYVVWFNNYEQRVKDLMENPNYGGALFGKMYGSNYRSVADLLSESSDFHMRESKEDIRGVTCVVLEGTSKYGKVTAWIAPEKGYNALKWTIEKTPHHLFDDAPIKLNGWEVSFSVREFHEAIHGDRTTFVPRLAQLTHTIDVRNAPKDIDHYEYETSGIELEPNFEALGAFKIDFPNGIRVYNRGFDAVPFVWQDGKPVPFVKRELLDVLDAELQQVKGEIEPGRIASTEQEQQVPPNEQTTGEDVQPEGLQVQATIPAQDGSNRALLAFIVLSIVAAGVCGGFLLRRRRS